MEALFPEREYYIHRGVRNRDHEEIDEALRRNPACINALEPGSGQTPLHIAGMDGSYQVTVKLCATPGIDFTITDPEGRTALEAAFLHWAHTKTVEHIARAQYPEFMDEFPDMLKRFRFEGLSSSDEPTPAL